jgi:signal-transduction protein with cAMP-binding, CBS, and nucleotidyltransferase domain
MPLMQAAQFITSGYHHSALVLDEINHLQGILTTQDLKRLLSAPATDRPLEDMTVQNICTSEVICTFADESLAEALKRMATRDLRQMPVVDRHQPKRVIGMVDRLAITTAYNTALTKRAITARITATKSTVPIANNTYTAITNGSSNGSSNIPSNSANDKSNDKDNNLNNSLSNTLDSNSTNNLNRESDIHSSEAISS